MISLLVPSRERPARFKEMWESAKKTATSDIECLVYVDEDDPTVSAYQRFGDITLFIAQQRPISDEWNLLADYAQGDILHLTADDLLFHTPGWDAMVAEQFQGDPYWLVWGRDGYQDQNLSTHPFVHRKWVTTVGNFVPDRFESCYVDTWLFDVATELDRTRYLPDLFIEHLHPAAGKAETDSTYAMGAARYNGMPELYESRADERKQWVSKLSKGISSWNDSSQ